MAQNRNKTGVDFEYSICESNGWTRVSKSPKLKWPGVGRSNFNKIVSVNFDSSNFKPSENSIFDKYDAVTPSGEKVEIKKYKISKLNDWVLYSEPIFKVASHSDVNKITALFGGGDKEKGVEVYNKFVNEMIQNVGQGILTKITQSNIGIQLEDGFVPQSQLEYRWSILEGWMGYNRLSIEFRIKS